MLLGEEELKSASLLVFANKQDIQGALGAGEIAEKLELAKKCKERYSLLFRELMEGIGAYELAVQSKMRD